MLWYAGIPHCYLADYLVQVTNRKNYSSQFIAFSIWYVHQAKYQSGHPWLHESRFYKESTFWRKKIILNSQWGPSEKMWYFAWWPYVYPYQIKKCNKIVWDSIFYYSLPLNSPPGNCALVTLLPISRLNIFCSMSGNSKTATTCRLRRYKWCWRQDFGQIYSFYPGAISSARVPWIPFVVFADSGI